MSASVPYFNAVADGEHPYHGAGADVSDAQNLSFTNPVAIDFEIQAALARENEREKAAMTRTSNTMEESYRTKKRSKFNFKTCCEWAVIGTVIAVVWGLLMLPTIYYQIPQVQWR